MYICTAGVYVRGLMSHRRRGLVLCVTDPILCKCKALPPPQHSVFNINIDFYFWWVFPRKVLSKFVCISYILVLLS